MCTSRDYWAWYEVAMAHHLRATDPHDRNLALADAQSCLSKWFEVVERELQTQAAGAKERATASRKAIVCLAHPDPSRPHIAVPDAAARTQMSVLRDRSTGV